MMATIAGSQTWTPDSTYDGRKVVRHLTDNFQSHYIITDKMEIIKLKSDGSYWQRYENNRLGAIEYLDVSNPLKILVFYAQHQTIISLDNNMSESGRMALGNLNLGLIRAIATSDDNNVWIWDESGRRLLKVNSNGQIVLEGPPVYHFNFQSDGKLRLIQKGNYLYLSQYGANTQIFDVFGKWIKTQWDED